MTELQTLKRGCRTAGLTQRQAETLRLLYLYRSCLGTPFHNGESERGWLRPVDLGGTAGSNRSHWLRNLVVKGLSDSRPYSPAGQATKHHGAHLPNFRTRSHGLGEVCRAG